MACDLVTNRARNLAELKARGGIGSSYDVKDSDTINKFNRELLDEHGSFLNAPRDLTPIDIDGETIIPNEEFFQRLDASQNLIYDENYKYRSDYKYSVEEREPMSTEELDAKLTEVLGNIGVTVSDSLNQRTTTVEGKANVFTKAVVASFDERGISSLPEEAAHMFVAFIKQHEPALFNRMMADIPKLDIYQDTKETYMPLYQNINLVKEEAIGKAIAHHLVEGNPVPSNNVDLGGWFTKVLNAFKKFLNNIGFNTLQDYNAAFELTADRILAGEFKGEFEGEGTFLKAGEAGTPLELLDGRSELLELRNDGFYYYNGKKIPERVTEKIRKKHKRGLPPAEETPLSIARREWGTRGHNDLMKLFNKAIADSEGKPYDFTPESSPEILSKLNLFVRSILDQFPDSKIRTEVKITDGKKLAGTVDLLIEDNKGYVHIFDYKFTQRDSYLSQEWEDQLGEYRKLLRDSYGFEKFGQVRIIPIRTEYTKSADNPTLSNIQIGNNRLQPQERSYLNPLPAPFERTDNEVINRLLDFLSEEVARAKNAKINSQKDRDIRNERVKELQTAIAELQISQDVTSLVDLAAGDLVRMKSIMEKDTPSESELIELYTLKNHYRDVVNKKYNLDRDGKPIHELTEASLWAQTNNLEVDKVLEDYFNTANIDTSKAIKPKSWWRRLTRLSDYDIPAFQSLQSLINTGYYEQEAVLNKQREEVKSIINQIVQERGTSTIAAFEPILQKGKGKLITPRDSSWYKNHKEALSDESKMKEFRKYFDQKAWKEYLDPLVEEFKESRRYLLTPRKGQTDAEAKASFDFVVKRFINSQIKYRGEGNANSKFYTVPDHYLNENWVKYVRDAPNSGLAKLYNKFVEINEYANENSDSNIPRNFLPYVRKRTTEMVLNGEWDIRQYGSNMLNSLKSYEWETFELDHNGQPVYSIPLKYGTDVARRDLDQQSYELGEMLMLWTESVYQNAYLQKTHSAAKLYQMALEKSREFVIRNGKPVKENGEFRTRPVEGETLAQYQEYLNMYYYGVQNEDSNIMNDNIWGLHPRKALREGMRFFSAKTLAFDIFNSFANVTGGLSNAIAIGARGNNFTLKQYKNAFTNLSDPKIRALLTLIDVDANVYDVNKMRELAISPASRWVSWDSLFVLQRKGDWALQNMTVGAMAQNFTVSSEGKIIKKKDGDLSLLELLETDSKGGIVIKGLDLTTQEGFRELFNWRNKVRSINSEILGMTPENDKFLAGNTLTGQLLLQFRRWALPMGVSRFGELRYNKQLEEFNYGRFRSTAKTLLNRRIFKALPELIALQRSPNFEEIILEDFKAAKELNPELEYEEYRNLIITNMRATAVESALVGLMAGLLMGLDDGEPSDDSLVERLLIRGFSRTSDELSFWYSPSSFGSIVQSPIPLLGLLSDLNDLLFASKDSIAAYFWGEDEDVEIGPRLRRLFIGTNAYEKFMRELNR